MCQPTYNLYPEIDPYHHGWLKVDNTHEIYYEECGNPDGRPIVFLHKRPGSGCNPGQRRFFDPKHYRIILLDQRGCNRSRPQGETADNTTQHLINDLESLRTHLALEAWHVFGGSWGSTLALSYATQHPDRVISLTLRGIFLSRPTELNWFLGDIQHFYPDVWQTLIEYLPQHERHDVLSAFEKRIASQNIKISYAAAVAWNNYENSIMRLDQSAPNTKSPTDSTTIVSNEEKLADVARARVQIHYIRNHCFIDGESLLQATKSLDNIPTTIVQGRYDMVCPPKTSWLLSKAMPQAEYIIVQNAGHSAMEPGVISALITSTEKFKPL
ncbi:MAG TPA: prolyl aminopeptidase [Methylophilaceae bacterium]|nr:prolyl aminopeptidase [Methylophilaceae bacterium]